MGLEISREWGQEPGWFFGLDVDEQVRLMAWFRVHQDPQGKHYKTSKKNDLSNLSGELEAARNAPSDERAVRPNKAPRGGPVRRGGAPHVKRR